MAQYPCSYCGRRYAGAQQTAYPAVVDGVSRFSQRMRLCPTDFERLVDLPWLSAIDSDDLIDSHGCSMCGADVARWAVFVPFYAAGTERSDLYGRVCGKGCLSKALVALYGPSHDLEAMLEELDAV